MIADAASGKSRTVLSEKDQYWINVGDDLRFLKDGKRFLWSSERSGYRHLYLYDLESKQLAQLTHGDWEVTGVRAVDEPKASSISWPPRNLLWSAISIVSRWTVPALPASPG